MVEAFIYMAFVGSGTSLGVAVVAFLSWKVYQRSSKKANNKKRKGVKF